MKILQLNVWTGRIKGALLNFFKENEFDVICLQEAVWSDNREMLEEFSDSVEQIKEASGLKYESRADDWSIKAFGTEVKQGIVILSREKIIEEKIKLVYGEYKLAETIEEMKNHCYKAQLVKLENGLYVLNYHGYWKPTPVGDETTTQVMSEVAKMLKGIDGPIVMCGDLNVTHESLAMRELDFLRDLTHEYDIDNTLVGLKFDGKVACDHILVNDKVVVKDFRALDGKIISDHVGLTAEIELLS